MFLKSLDGEGLFKHDTMKEKNSKVGLILSREQSKMEPGGLQEAEPTYPLPACPTI